MAFDSRDNWLVIVECLRGCIGEVVVLESPHGALFTPTTKHGNVATLPSMLSCLLGSDSQISGVNTPYRYFGMWRATFAWHVEDMDLFSINYIHFGPPKLWYAMPQSWASNLKTTMKGYFPHNISNCPQFVHHKSFLTSPPQSSTQRIQIHSSNTQANLASPSQEATTLASISVSIMLRASILHLKVGLNWGKKQCTALVLKIRSKSTL
ncbi:JmjC domain, hydroxylase-domain-containing protein [Hysterangium stoloniferum]|nr:JmjC domain, hydroxylase-domain-containing protein [Hysterangium stoloniferum]